jgi:amino acid adenylation domain-containing protein
VPFYPLSSAQQDLWSGRGPDSAGIGCYQQIHGPLDPGLLRRALTLLVAETGILRLVLTEQEGIPLQSFPELPEVELEVRDCSRADDPRQDAFERIRRTMDRPFRMGREPLFRFGLYRLSEGCQLWSQTYHPLVADDESLALVTARVASLYSTLLRFEAPQAAPGAPWMAFVEQEAILRHSARHQRHLHEWRKRCRALPVPARPALAGAARAGAVHTWSLPRAQAARLAALAQAHSATAADALLGLLQVQFCRETDRDACTIGVPALNRDTPALQGTIGPMAGLVPVRLRFDRELSFAGLIRQAAETLREVRRQPFPVGVGLGPETGRERLCDFSFSWLDQGSAVRFGPSRAGAAVRLRPAFEPLPLAVTVAGNAAEQDLQVDFSYDPACFDAGTMARFQDQVAGLLVDALDHPEWPVRTLDRAPSATAGGRGEPPSGDHEQLLARLWAEFLKTPEISRDDDFFVLGGHSLMLIRLLYRIEAEGLGEINLGKAMAARTLSGMAALLSARGAGRTSADVPDPAREAADFPLSSGQERFWFMQLLVPGCAYYNMPQAIDLQGSLDEAAFARALLALEVRHHALRTRIRATGRHRPEASQYLVPPGQLAPVILDLRTAADPGAAADARTQAESARPFQLEAEAPVRAFLFRIGEDRWRFLLVMHHIASDGWSVGVLLHDLAALYARETGAPAPDLPDLAWQIADHVAWQRALLDSAQGRGLLERRIRSLAGVERLALPTDRRRPAVRTFAGGTLHVPLEPATSLALDQMAREAGVTPYVLLLALVEVLLYRSSGLTRPAAFPLGTLFSGRDHAGLAGLVGFLVNTLVLPCHLDPDQTFRQHLAGVHAAWAAATEEQQCPFVPLAEAMDMPIDHYRYLHFDVLVTWQDTPVAPALPLLRTTPVVVDLPFSKFDFTFQFFKRGKEIELELEYSSELFDRPTVEAMVRRLQMLIVAALDQPATTLAQLDLGLPCAQGPILEPAAAPSARDSDREPPAGPTERALAAVWGEFLKTPVISRDDDFFMLGGHSLMLMRLVHRIEAEGLGEISLGQAMAARTLAAMAALLETGGTGNESPAPLPGPEAPAAAAGESAPTYDRDASLAALWQAAAARHGERTALVHGQERISYGQLDAWASRLAAGLMAAGVTKGGTVALALPRTPAAVAAILAVLKCGAAYLPLDEKLPPRMVAELLATCGARWLVADQAGCGRSTGLSGVRVLPLEGLAEAVPAGGLADPGTSGGDPAYVMFTSGSTGEPKGVVVPHRAVARLLETGALTLRPGQAMAQAAPFGFDAATLELWVPLLSGARLVFLEDGDLMEPERLEASLRQGGVTAMWLTASLFNRVADARPQAFRALSTLLTGGEVLSVPHLRKVAAACPGLRLINGYGPTENTTFTTVQDITAADLALDGVPIGRPVGHTRVHLLDAALQAVAYGEWGELCAAGDGLAIGYAGRPDLTGQVFVTLPGQPGERIYRTGDLARRRADGTLEFGGRRDGQIKLRGHRIETSAIEAVLAECPGVQDAAVLPHGAGEDRELVAFVAARGEDERSWRRHLAERLPIYMMPARFLTIPELPVNANGKKDRAALAGLLRDEPEALDFPLSDGQQRLWVMQRLAPDSAFYNVPLALDLQGSLDEAAFSRALVALETRHQALRLRIREAAGPVPDARQVLLAPGGLSPAAEDFSAAPDPAAAAGARMLAEASRPFRLETETPARAFLFRLAPDHFRFLLVLHHIACDGWSVGILMQDLAALYAAETGDPAPVLPPITLQVAGHVAAQRAMLRSEAGRAMLERRIRALTPVPEPLALPTDRRRPLVRSFKGGTLRVAFDPALSRALDQLAADAGVSPFVLMMALVEVLLYRSCGHGRSGDFNLGTLESGRDRSQLAGLVGFLVNTLVLPVHLDPEQTFRQHLAGVQAAWLETLADLACPFAQLVEAMNLRQALQRDLSRNPLFDVLVVWQEAMAQPLALPRLRTAPVVQPMGFSKFDLSFHFFKEGTGIGLELEYAADLFDPATVESLAHRLQALAAAALARPGSALDQLELWLPGERDQVLETFNATATDLPARRTIPELFLDALGRHSAAPAVLGADGEVVDYARFARRAGAVAAQLAARGVVRGDLVAVVLPRSADMMAAIHGILMAGAAYVPLDPGQPPARLRELLEDLGQPLVLAEPDLPAFVAIGAEPVSLAGPDDLAYIIFTSGSTGRPKGVLIEHHAVLNRILWMQKTFPIGPGDVILQKTPTTFDVSVWELFWWSWTGAAVAMLEPGAEKDPGALAAAIERHRVTTLHFVPSMLTSFLDGLESGRIDSRRIASLKRVFVSGEALEPALAERFNRLVHRRQRAELHNLYGPTEATVDVSWQPASPGPVPQAVSIGRPIANTRLHILDERHQPLPVGIPGEIAIGGVQVARGYLNRPELTREKFIADPFHPGGRLYLTGDLGRWRRDGSIDYLGRADWQVKIRGQRIEPGEIEHALEAHPDLDRAVVVPVLNQGLTELHAWILGSAAPADLRRFLRRQLPESMIPARFFPLEALPLTPSGKLDRSALGRRSLAMLAVPPAEPSGDPALITRFELDAASETLSFRLEFNPCLLPPDQAAALAGRFSSLLHELIR